MIVVVDALNRHKYNELLDEMFKLRKRVFHDRLGWEVDITDGKEIDMFDNLHPAYLIALDDEGDLVGCMRILQTTGPHMLADVFIDIMDGEPPVRSAQLWEVTRFCVDTDKLKSGKSRNSISYVTSELFVAATEYGKNAGILDAVAVIDPVMNRVMIRSQNAPYDYLGKTVQMGKVKAMAGLLDCTDERIYRLRAFNGIEGDVFAESDEVALERFASRPAAVAKLPEPNHPGVTDTMRAEVVALQTPAPTQIDLQSYFNEQIDEAESAEELAAAEALKAEMTKYFRNKSRCDA